MVFTRVHSYSSHSHETGRLTASPRLAEEGEADPRRTDFQQTTSIRLVSGPDGKPKGFGYVEFATADGLRSALTQSGLDLNGRTVRISVAEAPSHREGRADAESTWTRTGPLAAIPGRSGGGGFGAPRTGGGGGFGTPREEGEVEREGPIRGGKFTPSAPAPSRTGGFGGGGGARDGPREFQAAPQVEVEREGPIRGGKFTPSAPAPAPERRQVVEPSRADEDKTWSRNGPLPPAERKTGGFGFGRDREGSSRGSFGDRTRAFFSFFSFFFLSFSLR